MNIDAEIESSYKGFDAWKSLDEKYKLTSSDCIMIFPTDNFGLNKSVIKQIDEYAQKKHFDRIIILSDKELMDVVEISKRRVCMKTELFTLEQILELVKFVTLMNSFDQIIIVSDESPFGNLNFVSEYGLDIDDYVSGSYLWRIDATT